MKRNKVIAIAAAVLIICMFATVLVACNPKDKHSQTKYDPETRPFVMSIQQPDEVFNPFFSTSAYDSTIIGMTQISMLDTDVKGNILGSKWGELDNRPTVAKAYTITPYDANDNALPSDADEGVDHTVYEFLIKKGIKFSNGSDLTIKDVLFNLYVYLDPAYTGSATIYSTDIVGLKAYRTQEANANDDRVSSLEKQFATTAYNRRQNLIDYVTYYGKHSSNEPNLPLGGEDGYEWNNPAYAQYIDDYKTVAYNFLSELISDWNAINVEDYEDYGAIDGDKYEQSDIEAKAGFTKKWQIFMFNDGGDTEFLQKRRGGDAYLRDDENKNFVMNKTHANDVWNSLCEYMRENMHITDFNNVTDDQLKTACINYVYGNSFPMTGASKIFDVAEKTASDIKNEVKGTTFDITSTNSDTFETIVRYWATSETIMTEWTAKAKSDYYSGLASNMTFPTVEGITTHKTGNFMGQKLDTNDYDVLRIEINGVDPKAIYNFAFTVAPMYYYSGTDTKTGKDHIEAVNVDWAQHPNGEGITEFGVAYGSIDFMNDVVNAPNKIGVPVGAGTYMATNANDSDNPSAKGANGFFNNNMVYYKRNPYFETVGSGITNAAIKHVRYKVVESDQVRNALVTGDVDFGDPSATQEIAAEMTNAGLSSVRTLTAGYGYVGINPTFVPTLEVRQAIMMAFDKTIIFQDYYKGGFATNIVRPMSKTSWAYPGNVKAFGEIRDYYQHDTTGGEITKLVEKAGYTLSGGVYHKNITGFGDDKLNYKFTIAGASKDHPAYQMFLEAAKLLNANGFDVQVVTSAQALSDLSAGKLAVWAAAWSSGIDPDMYQVYHKDSQASSVNNWGYKSIKANTSLYYKEWDIINALSQYIDEARETNDQTKRQLKYKDALDKVMELAVEFPTYQRYDLSVYNGKVIDSSTLPKDTSPFSGLLARIWEVNYYV